jgi:Leucine-rich repeat (LRR) protein
VKSIVDSCRLIVDGFPDNRQQKNKKNLCLPPSPWGEGQGVRLKNKQLLTILKIKHMKQTIYAALITCTIAASLFTACKKKDHLITDPNANITAKFKDANFRNYIVDNFDKKNGGNNDGKIQLKEVNAVTEMRVEGFDIKSLAGIEYFTALTELECFYNALTNLDVSNNTALTKLDCRNNALTSLKLPNSTTLTDLTCSDNLLTNLDVSNNTALTGLDCQNNSLTSLDVSKNTALTYLYCINNQLNNRKSFDLRNNKNLKNVNCSKNNINDPEKIYVWFQPVGNGGSQQKPPAGSGIFFTYDWEKTSLQYVAP